MFRTFKFLFSLSIPLIGCFSSTQYPNPAESPTNNISIKLSSQFLSGLIKPYLSKLFFDQYPFSLQFKVSENDIDENG